MEGVPAAAVSNVLDDDDLLVEILLRVAFPTTLVRAALVCKRWFHHASHRGFLRRFRELHPPRLLGFYRSGRFVPVLPQPPELAAVVRRVASYSLGSTDDRVSVLDCRNGSVYAEVFRRGSGRLSVGVHNPLCPDRGVAVVPLLSRPQRYSRIFSKEKEQGGLSYMDASMWFPDETDTTEFTVFMLREGAWHMHASAKIQLPTCSRLQVVLFDDRIYLTGRMPDFIVLDLTTSTTSTVQLPQGVDYITSDIMLAPANDASRLYLIQVELQLRIWLRKGDVWLLLDTIPFREMVANLRMSDGTAVDEHAADVEISQVGDSAEFVFLKMGRCILYLDIKRRTMCKVHEWTQHDLSLDGIYPFMMIWPPTFPKLKMMILQGLPDLYIYTALVEFTKFWHCASRYFVFAMCFKVESCSFHQYTIMNS